MLTQTQLALLQLYNSGRRDSHGEVGGGGRALSSNSLPSSSSETPKFSSSSPLVATTEAQYLPISTQRFLNPNSAANRHLISCQKPLYGRKENEAMRRRTRRVHFSQNGENAMIIQEIAYNPDIPVLFTAGAASIASNEIDQSPAEEDAYAMARNHPDNDFYAIRKSFKQKSSAKQLRHIYDVDKEVEQLSLKYSPMELATTTMGKEIVLQIAKTQAAERLNDHIVTKIIATRKSTSLPYRLKKTRVDNQSTAIQEDVRLMQSRGRNRVHDVRSMPFVVGPKGGKYVVDASGRGQYITKATASSSSISNLRNGGATSLSNVPNFTSTQSVGNGLHPPNGMSLAPPTLAPRARSVSAITTTTSAGANYSFRS